MPRVVSRRPHVHTPKRANLHIKRRVSILHSVLPAVRWVAFLSLIGALTLGGIQWLVQPPTAGALEFTPHIVGKANTLPGIQGISAGDMNGDSKVDLVTAGLDGVKIYENKGKFSFTSHTITSKPAERVAIGDLNDDGQLDLVIPFKGNTTDSAWFENQGSFSFDEHTLTGSGGAAVAAIGDIDEDGAPDIVTAGDVGGQQVSLQRWMNNGDGQFSSTVLDGNSKVTAMAIEDVNENSYKDIVTGGDNGLQRWGTDDGITWDRVDIDDVNPNASSISIAHTSSGGTWIATGDATEKQIALYRSGSSGSEYTRYGRMDISTTVNAKTVLITDLDQDGEMDLVAAGQDDDAVFWYENQGSASFAKATVADKLQSVYGVAVADFNNDGALDVTTADHMRGTLYVYERVHAKPKATAPDNIQQSTAGNGNIIFETEVSDPDRNPSQIRVQYSLDGTNWYKPWLTSARFDHGTADLKNSNAYQVGSSNAIDTDSNNIVKVTLTWDTKSMSNTGGPIVGDVGTVRLRVIPQDDKMIGDTVTSSSFRVDNRAPQGLKNVRFASTESGKAVISWDKPTDSSDVSYRVYYGTNTSSVLSQQSAVWTSAKDESLGSIDALNTTITGLTPKTTYTFKVVASDIFGNAAGAPSVNGIISNQQSVSGTPTPSPSTSVSPTPLPTPSATPTVSVTPIPTVVATPSPSGPPTLRNGNRAPLADAGANQVASPNSLVMLSGAASYDPDPNDTSSLLYSWQQLSGPEVKLLSDRTSSTSFTAGDAGDTYIFTLTVRDQKGASSSANVTIATKAAIIPEPVTPVSTSPLPSSSVAPPPPPRETQSSLVRNILQPADILLFTLALISTIITIVERVGQAISASKKQSLDVPVEAPAGRAPQGRVVHYKTGEPIGGAQVLIYDSMGKLRATERTTSQGLFPTFFPAGQYTLDVRKEGFAIATAAKAVTPAEGILYSGGKITVTNPNQPLIIAIALKPTGSEVSPMRVQLLHLWQTVQHTGRVFSWPLFLSGALLNTALVFISPSLSFLVLEVLYIMIVVLKIALEMRMRPAYGLVRDAITHVPLDLAVVRLFEQGSNRLIMTRVANNQGKFFALPPAGTYTITITKPGYANFTKENLEIKAEHDTTLQMTADLMPVAPQATLGTLQARAAAI